MAETATPSETPESPPPRSSRDEAMAAIEQQNNERVAKELGIPVDDLNDSSDPDADPADAEAEAERKRLEQKADQTERQVAKQLQTEKPADKAEPTVLDHFENVMVKTKVDGQEVLRPLADLVRIEQKEAAAAQRLQQATQMREEAERLLAAAREQPAKPAAESTPKPAAETPPLGKEFLDAIYAGEEDKALEAFNKLFGNEGRKNATPDAATIAAQVKQQIDTDTALQGFGTTYPEIIADPYLADVADKFLIAELQVGTPLRDALTKAGDATRDWLKQKNGNGSAPTPASTSRDEKRSRKDSIDNIPSVAATATTSREPTVQPVTEILDEMRKSRGLAY
jgi:hypothetical protein